MIQQVVKLPVQDRPLEMFEVTDPTELAAAAVRRKYFDKNSAWLQAHIADFQDPKLGGKFLCVAGEEGFVGDSVADVTARARAAHPSDVGFFTAYIPREKVPRVYAN
jgi:hypothetical protein